MVDLSRRKRAMALDVGDARIGLALSDPLGLSAQPLSTLERSGSSAEEIAELAKQNDVSTLVVGLPKTLDGEIGEQAQKVLKFKEELQNCVDEDVQIVEWDERLTTVEASRIIQGSKLKNKKRRQALDRISAAIILESYLASQG